MSIQCPHNDDLPDFAYPLVANASDRHSARRAFYSTTALLDYRAEHQGDLPFFCPIDLEAGVHKTYSFRETREMVVRFAKAHSQVLSRRKRGDKAVVVALIGPSGEDHWFHDRALQRLGHVPLHLSSTLSPAAAENLIDLMGATHLLLGPESDLIVNQINRSLKRFEWYTTESVPAFHTGDEAIYRTELPLDEETNETAAIFHSTGSTADPKPIQIRHRALGNMCAVLPIPYPALTLTATYHSYAWSSIQAALGLGTPVFVAPAMQYTAQNILKCIIACRGKAGMILVLPYFLQLLLSHPDGLDQLRHFQLVRTVGGPLPLSVVDTLITAGVNVQNMVSATESSICMIHLDKGSLSWEWLDPAPGVEAYFSFEEYDVETGSCELVLLPGYPLLRVWNRPGGGYATNDLYLPHPTIPGKWKFDKRKDDVIVHSSAVKSDPAFIEKHLLAAPDISHAVIIGANRLHVVALIIPVSDSVNLATLRDILDELNSKVPEQSRLYDNRVRILPVTDTFVMSSKGTVIRKKTEIKYEKVIEEIYATSR